MGSNVHMANTAKVFSLLLLVVGSKQSFHMCKIGDVKAFWYTPHDGGDRGEMWSKGFAARWRKQMTR